MDLKSCVVLGVCLIIAALIVAIAPRGRQTVGRYQMCGVPAHAYVIDTITGQVWENYANPNGGGSSAEFEKPKAK